MVGDIGGERAREPVVVHQRRPQARVAVSPVAVFGDALGVPEARDVGGAERRPRVLALGRLVACGALHLGLVVRRERHPDDRHLLHDRRGRGDDLAHDPLRRALDVADRGRAARGQGELKPLDGQGQVDGDPPDLPRRHRERHVRVREDAPPPGDQPTPLRPSPPSAPDAVGRLGHVAAVAILRAGVVQVGIILLDRPRRRRHPVARRHDHVVPDAPVVRRQRPLRERLPGDGLLVLERLARQPDAGQVLEVLVDGEIGCAVGEGGPVDDRVDPADVRMGRRPHEVDRLRGLVEVRQVGRHGHEVIGARPQRVALGAARRQAPPARPQRRALVARVPRHHAPDGPRAQVRIGLVALEPARVLRTGEVRHHVLGQQVGVGRERVRLDRGEGAEEQAAARAGARRADEDAPARGHGAVQRAARVPGVVQARRVGHAGGQVPHGVGGAVPAQRVGCDGVARLVDLHLVDVERPGASGRAAEGDLHVPEVDAGVPFEGERPEVRRVQRLDGRRRSTAAQDHLDRRGAAHRPERRPQDIGATGHEPAAAERERHAAVQCRGRDHAGVPGAAEAARGARDARRGRGVDVRRDRPARRVGLEGAVLHLRERVELVDGHVVDADRQGLGAAVRDGQLGVRPARRGQPAQDVGPPVVGQVVDGQDGPVRRRAQAAEDDLRPAAAAVPPQPHDRDVHRPVRRLGPEAVRAEVEVGAAA